MGGRDEDFSRLSILGVAFGLPGGLPVPTWDYIIASDSKGMDTMTFPVLCH